MRAHTIITKERMVEELTQYRTPALSPEEAIAVSEVMSNDLSFWMEVDQLFHKRAEEVLKDLKEEVS